MTRNDEDHSTGEEGLMPADNTNPSSKTQRREPKFGSFYEDEDEYEEPDRDTDYTSDYRADDLETEEEFEESYYEEEESSFLAVDDDDPEYLSASVGSEFDPPVADEADDWLEEEQDQDSGRKWPFGQIAVAITALVLLIAGGYGVMQQRAATEEELRQLRATLATSADAADERAGRKALRELQVSYEKLAANAEALTLENRRLTDTVAGLEAQLGVQQAALTKPVPAAKPVKPQAADAVSKLYGENQLPSTNQVTPTDVLEASSPKPVPPTSVTPKPAPPKTVAPKPAAPKPAAPKPAAVPTEAAASSGPWFVNFGSYSSRSMAETWARKLSPNAGNVIIAPNAKDGQTLYRVRVVELASKGSAEEVARQLEAQMQVSRLWVGKQE
jgi:cell division protein FtsN